MRGDRSPTSDGGPRAPSRVGRAVLLGVILGGALMNLAQFPAIEAHTFDHWRALLRYDSPELSRIGLELGSASNVREHFGPVLALSEVAAGVELIVPDDHDRPRPVDDRNLLGLARVAQLRTADYDPAEVPSLDAHIVAAGEGGPDGNPFRVAVADEQVTRMVLFIASDDASTLTFADVRLLADDHPAVAP